MTKQNMIDVLIEQLLEYWIDAGCGDHELIGLLYSGWIGYEKYSKKELQEEIEGKSLTKKEIKEYLANFRYRLNGKAVQEESDSDLPF